MGSMEGRHIDMEKEEKKERLLKRLRRIEGQIRGIEKMVEEEKLCADILVQISAATGALKKVGLVILEEHTKHCLLEALEENKEEEVLAELLSVMTTFFG